MSLCWSNVPKDSAALLCIGIDGDTLYIADLWDTRREPRAQAGDVK